MNQPCRCSRCGSQGNDVTNCVSCTSYFCSHCLSCAGYCSECTAKSECPAVFCAICSSREEELYRCVMCKSSVCKRCILGGSPNRPTTIVCKGCQIPSSFVLNCSRCGGKIKDESVRYFCEVCADSLCSDCLPLSFECGVLKCQSCCSLPIRSSNYSWTRTVLDDQLKNIIVSMNNNNNTIPSKYRSLRKCSKLGEGGQGVVFKCLTFDNEVVVSKEMSFAESDRALYNARLLQAEKMRKLSHKHLIRYLDVFGSENPLKISVIMPYYSEGDLFKFIKRQKGAIEEHKLCSIILQIATALNYLHTQKPPLAHRDIKPDNILLLNQEEQVLLMDLDLCSSCDTQPSAASMVLNGRREASPTFEYRAPEMAHSTGSTKSDIFSLGVVAFVLATLPEFAMLRNSKGATTVLSDSDWTKDSLAIAVRQAILYHTRQYSDSLITLIIQMLTHDPSSRPTAAEVVTELSTIMEKRLLRTGR